MSEQEINWQAIGAALRAPFDPTDVDFRPQGGTFGKNGVTMSRAIAYIDARTVQDRLDAVCGVDGWSFDFEPLATAGGKVTAAKGKLTIFGVTKCDVGDGDATETTKASVSDALKRAAVQFGIGRYLYGLGPFWVTLKKDDNGKIIGMADGEADHARAKLPRSDGRQAPVAPVASRSATAALAASDALANERQVASIRKLCTALGRPDPDYSMLTYQAARVMLTELSAAYSDARRAS